MKQNKIGFYISYSYNMCKHYADLLIVLRAYSIKNSDITLSNYSTTACPTLYKLKIPFPQWYVRWKIKRRLKKVSLLIVLLGSYYDTSKWMQFETAEAKRTCLPVLGVFPTRYPRARKRPDSVLYRETPWNEKEIHRALTGMLKRKNAYSE